jgi:hypothetical protein
MEEEIIDTEVPTDISPAQSAQIRRASDLLDLSAKADDRNVQFALQVGALHLARSIPEYWFTAAEQIPADIGKTGSETEELKRRLRSDFECVFETARRYKLLTELRSMDFHFEPLVDPLTVGMNGTYGRGRPMKLAAGPGPGSVAYFGGNTLVSTGSGRRVGRKNYYQIQKCRFVDFEREEAVPLDTAIRQFLEDVPACIAKLSATPEFIEWVESS